MNKLYFVKRLSIVLVLFISFFSECEVDKEECYNCYRVTNNGFQWIHETKYICGNDAEMEYQVKENEWTCPGYVPGSGTYDLCFKCVKSGYPDKKPCGDEEQTRVLAEGYECFGTPVDTLWHNSK